MSVVARAFPTESRFPSGSEIVRITYELGRLELTIHGLGAGAAVRVTFLDVTGFRVLDERDLLDFWPTCSTANGWLFEILSGGWLDQESQRDGFIMRVMNEKVTEYFVTGEEDCVNVLAKAAPLIEPINDEGERRGL